jgi:hypothetical protein
MYAFVYFSKDFLSHTDLKDFKDGYAIRYAVIRVKKNPCEKNN